MADQLLSQADVDALVLSPTRSEPPASAPAPAPARPPAADLGNRGTNINKAPTFPVKSAPLPVKNAAVSNKPQTTNKIHPSQVIQTTASKLPPNIRQEQKYEGSADAINTLKAKIASLTEQLTQMGNNIKRMEKIEKKVIDLEIKLEKNQQSQVLLPRVNQLSEELKKISANLKGTPGYGVRHSFTCEKCNDHGHVAEMFRCTKCGHERWYGWWPSK
jgi:uncharacterized phage infection (PIP) family protein YhgE